MLSASDFVTTHLKRLDDYISGVTTGQIVSGKLQRQAVERFVDHKTKYIFKEKELIKILRFCSLLNIPFKNEVQQVQLLGWQVFVIASLYCLYKTNDLRLYDLAYIEISKKQGKTTLCAILSLIDCLIDGELNASVMFVACSKDQSRIALDITKSIIINSPLIQSLFTVNKNLIFNNQKGSINKIEVKASDSKLVQGSGVSCSIVDEFAFAVDSELQNKIKSGQIARKNPIQIIITTACNNKQSPAFALRETSSNILDQVISNDSIFALVFCLDDPKTEQDQPDSWIKSNPSLGHTVQLESLVREYESAKLLPDKLNTFLTDNLNIWTDNLIEVWIEDDIIKDQMKDNLQIPEGADVFIGLDTSANSDLCSIGILYFDKKEDTFIGRVINIFPSNEKRRIRAGSIDLGNWIKDGHIIQCQTPVIDEDLLFDLLVDLKSKYKIRSVGIDPWNSQALKFRLEAKINEVNAVRQNVQSLSYPLKVMESYLLKKKMFLSKSPVVRWMFQNVKIYTDHNHNKKIDKRKREAVDGVVALNIAMHECLAYNQQGFGNLANLVNSK